jgi:hypothetical protein
MIGRSAAAVSSLLTVSVCVVVVGWVILQASFDQQPGEVFGKPPDGNRPGRHKAPELGHIVRPVHTYARYGVGIHGWLDDLIVHGERQAIPCPSAPGRNPPTIAALRISKVPYLASENGFQPLLCTINLRAKFRLS